MERVYLSVAEILDIHEMVLRHSGGMPGVRDQGLLEAAVFRPQSGYYSDVVEEAAALLESLVQNHPFQDGNKRTAWIAVTTFLNLNGFDVFVTTDQAEHFLLENLSRGTLRFPRIRDWLVSVSKPLPE